MTDILHILTPRQKPIEAPCHMNVSSMTLSKICARGRYDMYTSFSVSCKEGKKRETMRVKERIAMHSVS